MSYGVAPSRSATAFTWSPGTYRNSASGSTNRLMSHGHAIRSTFGRSRVTHFIRLLLSVSESVEGRPGSYLRVTPRTDQPPGMPGRTRAAGLAAPGRGRHRRAPVQH